MLKRFLLGYSGRFLSKWVVLFIDYSLVVFSIITAYLLRFNFELSADRQHEMLIHILVIPLFFTGAFLFFRTYRGVIRHTGLHEVTSIFAAVAVAIGALFITCQAKYLSGLDLFPNIPLSIILITFLSTLFLMIAFRLFIKVFYLKIMSGSQRKVNVLIYGAGELGRITRSTITSARNSSQNVVAFIDDNPSLKYKRLDGLRILRPEDAMKQEFLIANNITEVIIAISGLSPERKQRLVDLCIDNNIIVKTIPPVESWINGSFSPVQIKKVRFEDLLERPPIKLDNLQLYQEITGKTVMVTGAAGSIGSGLAKLLRRLHPAHLVLVDQAETPLFHLEQYFLEKPHNARTQLHYVMADVSNSKAMAKVFEAHRPDIIYHAAAYKHVPMMELNPREAIRVNVMGTRVLARLALAYQVKKFVFISTDKAVNPTSVMGASKRAAEIFVQSLNDEPGCKTRYITTRFGNVLGSNGSVIPLFERQIAAGGPVKVTHPDITRYFMTIPEACSLVLEAGAMGKGGEIFLFDMGRPVRIADVAHKMIKLSGLEPGKDIHIQYSGLRPGEKLYEELLADKEKTMPTHHEKIMIARVRQYDFHTVVQAFNHLNEIMSDASDQDLVKALKNLIPEYVSNNSCYEVLDTMEEGGSKK